MQVTCTSCRTPVEIDANQTTPPSGWGCPRCKAVLPAVPQAGPPPRRETQAAPWQPTPEIDAWLRRQLETMRAEVKEEVASEILSRALGGFRAGSPGVTGPASFGRNERSRLALVITEDQVLASQVIQGLQQCGYAPELVADHRAAGKRLQQADPAVVVVDQTLGGEPQAGFKVLEWINAQPGPRRRRTYVAFVSGDVRSMDSGSAFICGANLTINRSDATRFGEALKQGIEERDELYRVFMEVTDEVQG